MRKRNWNYVWQKFGQLILIREVENNKGYRYWLFKCSCWNEKQIALLSVLKWVVNSCGCLNHQKWVHNPLHKYGSRTNMFYKRYHGILGRCNNRINKVYPNYWWRWIKCLWETFDDFMNDMYDSYLEHKSVNKHTLLDRIDNDWHYCKENCRWVNHSESNRNHRRNHRYEIDWQKLCVTDIAKKYNINPNTLFVRLFRGESIEKAIRS